MSYQKIRSLENVQIGVELSRVKLSEMFTTGQVEFTVQEKIDGANASFTSAGTIHSHHKDLDDSKSGGLLGFYQFAQPFVKRLQETFPEKNFRVYGEWLVQHSVKYKEDLYKHFYVFDVYDLEVGEYLPQDVAEKIASDLELPFIPFREETVEASGLLDKIRKIGEGWQSPFALSGQPEGIVVKTDAKDYENKRFAIKFVLPKFKETKGVKKQPAPSQDQLRIRAWFGKYLTDARVIKTIHKAVDEDALVVTKDLFKTEWPAILTQRVIDDIKEESLDTPEPELVEKYSSFMNKVTRGQVSKTIALWGSEND